MIKGIKFASVPTRDQEKALKFFTEKLGFQILTDQPFGSQRWIELGISTAETNLVLFTSPGHEQLIGQFSAGRFLERQRGVHVQGDECQRRAVRAAAENGTLGNVRDFQGPGRESVPDFVEMRAVPGASRR